MPLQKNDEPIPHHILLKFLGRGSLGDVWLARGPGGVHKALKFMRLERSGIKELMAIQRMKSIHHPHLVQITDVWMLDREGNVIPDDDIESLSSALSSSTSGRSSTATIAPNLTAPETLAVAMTLADRSLADRLEECVEQGMTGIPREELLGYFREAAKGLDFLNQPHAELNGKALQHCDVKPQNLLLVGGSVQICDFGLARLVGEQKTMNQVEGTLAFIAPEAARGKQPTSTTDQYSLAISYYQLLTGSFPFDADASMYTILAVHTSGTLDFSLTTPAEQKVLRKATAVNPDKRYPTTQEFVDALTEANSPKAQPARRTPIAAIVGISTLLMALVGAFAMLSPRTPEVPLPPQFVAAPDAAIEEIGGVAYPEEIVRRFEDGLEVPFRLVYEPEMEQLFYIMTDKVWESLFRRFVDARPAEFEEYPWSAQGSGSGDLPAYQMTVEQAYAFSQWLVGEQGHLPSVEQWDAAAGRFRPDYDGAGPYLEPFQSGSIACGGVGPLPVGTAENDVSPFGVRDMAGNGYEFTRSIHGELTKEVPLAEPDELTGVVPRGQPPSAPKPLEFTDFEDSLPLVYTEPWKETGFRVVVQKLSLAAR